MSKELVDPRDISKNFWNNLSSDDFSAPMVSIGQGTGTKGLPGNFIFNSGDQKPELLNCKLLYVKKGRVLYGNQGEKSICGSDDFYKPSERHENKMASDCQGCPLKDWKENEYKKEIKKKFRLERVKDFEKPMCHETYNLLMADENCNPFFISFQKTQLKIVSEKLLSRLRMSFGNHAPFLVAFDMSLMKKQGGGNTYYTTVFENFRPVVDKEADVMTGLYTAWSARATEVLARQHEESDNEWDAKEKTVEGE